MSTEDFTVPTKPFQSIWTCRWNDRVRLIASGNSLSLHISLHR